MEQEGIAMITYEQKLDSDVAWAFREGSMHFEKENAVHKALFKITRRLAELGIPYAVVGGMAMFFHGYRRFTEDVGILVTREGLQEIHARLEGPGYTPPFSGSKQLRDAELGVRIEFLITGAYPGDGQPKPIAFPNPAESATVIDDISTIKLTNLLELKLASGMTGSGRLRDLADVQELIKALDLPRSMADQLHVYVRAKFLDLWDDTHKGGIPTT
jgi:hypothetical protein